MTLFGNDDVNFAAMRRYVVPKALGVHDRFWINIQTESQGGEGTSSGGHSCH